MVNPIQNQFGTSGISAMQRPERRDLPLTDDQMQQIQKILSNYDPANITEEDAKSIFESFQEAGIQPGRGMRETIEAAGFDAEALRAIGMPQPPQGMNRPQQASAEQAGSGFLQIGSSKGVDYSALQLVQTILNQYDLNDMNSETEKSLISQLGDAGLLFPGTTIDIKS